MKKIAALWVALFVLGLSAVSYAADAADTSQQKAAQDIPKGKNIFHDIGCWLETVVPADAERARARQGDEVKSAQKKLMSENVETNWGTK